MKAEKFHEMGIGDLREEEQALGEQLFKLRVQMATGQLENSAKLRQVRKDLARVKTVLTVKQAEG
ncbi:MAG: 50S ribosomal protein L29 [Acidobacteriota bacterium]